MTDSLVEHFRLSSSLFNPAPFRVIQSRVHPSFGMPDCHANSVSKLFIICTEIFHMQTCNQAMIRVQLKLLYRCICRICRTKKIHRTDRIHSISYKKLYMSFLLYWAFVREVSIKLYLSYEFFSYDSHDRYDRYNDMETRLNVVRKRQQTL